MGKKRTSQGQGVLPGPPQDCWTHQHGEKAGESSQLAPLPQYRRTGLARGIVEALPWGQLGWAVKPFLSLGIGPQEIK